MSVIALSLWCVQIKINGYTIFKKWNLIETDM